MTFAKVKPNSADGMAIFFYIIEQKSLLYPCVILTIKFATRQTKINATVIKIGIVRIMKR